MHLCYKELLSKARNHILLIGSSDVVVNMIEFSEFIAADDEGNYINEFIIDEHNELLTKLIMSMRFDLYKRKQVNKDYPLVSLTGS